MASNRVAMPVQENAIGEIKDESSRAGVSWPAVFAGAFAMGAFGLILGVLGAGVGLSSFSPWLNESSQASRVSAGAIIWLILVQLVASAIGGYLAGRLRTKWVSLHAHEVYFRDTAHGFIAWTVALVISSSMFMSYATFIAARAPALSAENTLDNYFVDAMFRTDHPAAARNDQPLRSEAALILTNALRHPDMGKQDEAYLSSLVVAATGLTQGEAERRVREMVASDREAADAARKAVAHSLYWLFVALLIGAFCASYAATIGGRQRDSAPARH